MNLSEQPAERLPRTHRPNQWQKLNQDAFVSLASKPGFNHLVIFKGVSLVSPFRKAGWVSPYGFKCIFYGRGNQYQDFSHYLCPEIPWMLPVQQRKNPTVSVLNQKWKEKWYIHSSQEASRTRNQNQQLRQINSLWYRGRKPYFSDSFTGECESRKLLPVIFWTSRHLPRAWPHHKGLTVSSGGILDQCWYLNPYKAALWFIISLSWG